MRTTGSQFLGFQGPTEDPAARRKLIPPGISLQSFQTLRKREVLIKGKPEDRTKALGIRTAFTLLTATPDQDNKEQYLQITDEDDFQPRILYPVTLKIRVE